MDETRELLLILGLEDLQTWLARAAIEGWSWARVFGEAGQTATASEHLGE